jgi:hypothetical protein
MPVLHPDVEASIAEVLADSADQSPEFKRRFQRLVENATLGQLPDTDVKEVIELAYVVDEAED